MKHDENKHFMIMDSKSNTIARIYKEESLRNVQFVTLQPHNLYIQAEWSTRHNLTV